MLGSGVADLAVCSSCGHRAVDAGDVGQGWRMRADLEVLWLVMRARRVQSCRFCLACAPDGLVTDIACVVCGDGPLLVGELAEPRYRERVWRWLKTRGWRTGAGLVCPSCMARRSDRCQRRDQGQGRLW